MGGEGGFPNTWCGERGCFVWTGGMLVAERVDADVGG